MRKVSVCEQVRRLFAGRKLRDGDGIVHPSWLVSPTPGDVVIGLWALGFKPEYPSSRKSPVPFRRYFNRETKTTLIVEPWGYECIGRCPEIANTKKKRFVQYKAELQRRLDGNVEVDADAAIERGVPAKVICTSWWFQGPDVWVKINMVQEPWSWEVTSFVLIEGIHPAPTPPTRDRNALRNSVTILSQVQRRGMSTTSTRALKRRLSR